MHLKILRPIRSCVPTQCKRHRPINDRIRIKKEDRDRRNSVLLLLRWGNVIFVQPVNRNESLKNKRRVTTTISTTTTTTIKDIHHNNNETSCSVVVRDDNNNPTCMPLHRPYLPTIDRVDNEDRGNHPVVYTMMMMMITCPIHEFQRV